MAPAASEAIAATSRAVEPVERVDVIVAVMVPPSDCDPGPGDRARLAARTGQHERAASRMPCGRANRPELDGPVLPEEDGGQGPAEPGLERRIRPAGTRHQLLVHV